MHTRLHNLALAALLTPAVAVAQADPPVYHVTDMAAPLEALFDYEFLTSQSRAINKNGDLIGEVGVEGGLQHSFIFTFEYGLVVLPLLDGAPATQAMDLTDRDENGDIIIVGGSVHGVHDYAIDAAVWRFSTVTGEVIETRNVGNLPGMNEGKLVAVNNNGKAVGYQGQDVHEAATKYDIVTGVLEPLSFPVRATDINNADQIIGDRYQGDLFGGFFELVLPPDCISLTLTGISDDGSLAGRAGRPYSDGAGRTLASWVRLTDAGWLVPDPGSPWDTGFAINNNGDFTIGYGRGWDGGIYIDGQRDEYAINTLLPETIRFRYSTDVAYGINDNLQIAAASNHAVLLTPIGTMIIPGDVNGDVAVNHDDHCAWTANPIDLDGDGRVGPEDEQWLIDRLAVFGYEYRDCNGNGVNDHCDITGGVSNDCNGNDIPDECEPDCDGDGIPDSCESDCNGNGIPDDCDIRSGFSEDCNENGIPDECDDANTVEGRLDYGPGLWLYDGVHFVDSLTVTEVGTIADVDFTIHDDFRIGQTTVRLSHAGVTVTLIDQPGHPASRDGFVNLGYDITLDDEGAGPGIETVGDTCCRFGPIVSPPSYRPHEPLSAFDGLPREGVWTVEFIGGFAQAADPRLYSWSVLVTDQAADPGECCAADFDGDGELTIFDFLAFQNAFDSGCA
ncbi:MAG: DUF3466 family protein [Phycisphaera sp.]|nr:MAG: DUF3466 family protein [Phycisphaera sp.]